TEGQPLRTVPRPLAPLGWRSLPAARPSDAQRQAQQAENEPVPLPLHISGQRRALHSLPCPCRTAGAQAREPTHVPHLLRDHHASSSRRATPLMFHADISSQFPCQVVGARTAEKGRRPKEGAGGFRFRKDRRPPA